MKQLFSMICKNKGVFLFFLFIFSCSKPPMVCKVGVDPLFSPLPLKDIAGNPLGFVQEFLLDMTSDRKVEFEMITVFSEQLYHGLKKKGLYEVAITTKRPDKMNEEIFDFSLPFLFTGPSILYKEKKESLSNVGILDGMSVVEVAKGNPHLTFKRYSTVGEIVTDLLEDRIEAGLIPRLMGIGFLKEYPELSLSEPLNDEGLRFVAFKGEQKKLLKFLDGEIQKREQNSSLLSLQKKWLLN